MRPISLFSAVRTARRSRWGRGTLSAAVVAVALLGSGVAAVAGTPGSAQALLTGCQVQYTVYSDWGTGFDAAITITNQGSPITNWTFGLGFAGNQTVSQGWNGNWSQSGQNITVTNASWNGTLGTGASTQIGAIFSYSGSNSPPFYATLNGFYCTGVGGDTTGISIVSPAAGQVFSPPANITITATAFEADHYIAKMEFFSGTTLIGTSTTGPATFSFTWTNVQVGAYTLTAVAIDNGGNALTSAPVSIYVAHVDPPSCPF
jgi:Cellulose binding domain/Bacterial Ig domain